MTKKALKKKVQAKPAISKFTAPVVDSARDVWLAGLGALSVAQTESGKLIEQGNKLFDKLVSEGSKLEKKTRVDAETTVSDIKGGVESKIDSARQQATENWDNLANIFDERVSGALDRLGIPTTRDLNELSGHVRKMSRQATKNWKELEDVFEQRVSGVLDSVFEARVTEILGGLGIPTTDDTGKLSAELEKLSRQVAAMEKDMKASTKAVEKTAVREL